MPDNPEKPSVEKADLLDLKNNQFLDVWENERATNTQFSDHFATADAEINTLSKDLLSRLMGAVANPNLPTPAPKELDPIFAIWHNVREAHFQNGFTAKDTAMLIFSLKSSLLKFTESNTDEADEESMQRLSTLVDLLGLLAFEIYSAEKEQLIGQQNQQISYLQEKRSAERFGNLIGQSDSMASVYKAIGMVINNDVTVLLEGESGTGKDVIANEIHKHSSRKKKPFITLNCGAIPKDLIESELFGHEKGAFTGATEKRLGKFELASGGTLFLDEIGELPLDLQTKLLRVLQNREIERIGGSDKIKLDVRILTATNKDLKKEVDDGTFRLDLYYRINVFPIHVPPLRDRKEDIIPLAIHFLEVYTEQYGTPETQLTSDAQAYLLKQLWEGNIRELENLIQRTIIMANGQPITAALMQLKPGEKDSLMLRANPSLAELPAPDDNVIIPLDDLEKEALKKAYRLTNGNIQRAAKSLGISRTTFYNKATKYGIELN
ncbi:sigma-54-dependent Fis family transcriptional regulator [bacterium]|jgi:transcriptional regulator with GAF, ATPase, and Fis domain|nr:sigma-54-dependent Fis family transcriptional regulator [bacterium]